MITKTSAVSVVTLVLVLTAACGSDADLGSTTSTASTTFATSTTGGIEASSTAASTIAPPAPTEPIEQAADFPIARFAAISEDPVTEELAAKFQVALALTMWPTGAGCRPR